MQIDHWGAYYKNHDGLASIINQAIDIASCCDLDSLKNSLRQIGEELNNRKTIRVSFIGSIASGKSSIINTLLGETVAPCYPFYYHCPCLIMYGAEREVILYFKDDISSNELEILPAVIKKHIQANGVSNIPPMRIDVNKLDDNIIYLTSLSSKIEVHTPNDSLKDQFEIIELPCVNNPCLCADYLCADDIVIMTLNACAICSNAEMDIIEYELKARGITPIFVITHSDLMTDVQKDTIQKFAKHKLSSYSPYDILLVSTTQAIEGLKENDKASYDKSNMDSLTALLSSVIQQRRFSFFTNLAEGMRRKLLPYTLIGDSNNDNWDFQENKQSLINTGIEYQRQFISNQIKHIIEYHLGKLEHISNEYLYLLTRQIPLWTDSYSPHHRFVIPNGNNIKQLVSEFSCYIENKISENFQEWARGTLHTEIEQMFLSKTEGLLLEIYKALNDHYPSSTIKTISSCRTKQIKDGLVSDKVFPSITLIKGAMDNFYHVDFSLTIARILHLFIIRFPSYQSILDITKKEISAIYCENVVKNTPAVISNVRSAVGSRFEEFNHIVSTMIQEDMNFLDYYGKARDNLAISILFKNVLAELDSYIAHLPNYTQ